MRIIWAIAVKELKLISRDKMGMFFILGFPLLMGLFFGAIMSGPSNRSTKSAMKIAIVDEDDSEYSRRFVDLLGENENVALQPMDREQAMEQVRKGQLVGMLALPERFGESAGIPWKPAPTIEIGMDPSRMAESAMAEGFVMQSMGKLYGDRLFQPDAMRPIVDELRTNFRENRANVTRPLQPAYEQLVDSLDALFDSVDAINEAESEPEQTAGSDRDGRRTEPKTAEETQPATATMQFAEIKQLDVTRQFEKGSQADLVRRIRTKWDITFPQAMVWGILGCVAGFSVSIVRERVRGTFQRLEIAPITKGHILIGKGLACFIAVFSVILALTAIGYGLGMRPEQPVMLAVTAAVIGFCFVGVMMFISVLGRTEEAVGGAGWCINMVMAMLGGGMVPLLFLPAFMRPLSNFSPVKWAVLALEGTIWRGFTLTEMLFPLTILVAVGVAGIGFGTYRLVRTSY